MGKEKFFKILFTHLQLLVLIHIAVEEEYEISLENTSELRAKIIDLENNLELIVNSLTEQDINIIKELSNKFGSDDR